MPYLGHIGASPCITKESHEHFGESAQTRWVILACRYRAPSGEGLSSLRGRYFKMHASSCIRAEPPPNRALTRGPAI